MKIESSQIVHPEDIKGWGEERIEDYVINNLTNGLLDQIKKLAKLQKIPLERGKVRYVLSLEVKDGFRDSKSNKRGGRKSSKTEINEKVNGTQESS